MALSSRLDWGDQGRSRGRGQRRVGPGGGGGAELEAGTRGGGPWSTQGQPRAEARAPASLGVSMVRETGHQVMPELFPEPDRSGSEAGGALLAGNEATLPVEGKVLSRLTLWDLCLTILIKSREVS